MFRNIVIFLFFSLISCNRNDNNSDGKIRIEILDNGLYGHDDLVFRITGLTSGHTFDTYYFGISDEAGSSPAKKNIANYLEKWSDSVDKMREGDIKYLPIDISDEYIGCFKIIKRGDTLDIVYGYSRTQGSVVDLKNPYYYFDSIRDFKAESVKTISFTESDFLNSLSSQINNLKK